MDSAKVGDDISSDTGILSGPNGKCETSNVGDDRLHIPPGSSSFSPVQRVAGLINGNLDPGETFLDFNGNGKFDVGEPDIGLFTNFFPDSRVSANSVGTVVYMAADDLGDKGIYTSQLDFISPDALNPSPFSVNSTPIQVVKKGDILDGVGTVQDLDIYDPLNNHDRQNKLSNRGNIAFWLLTADNKQAVVRATPLCNGSDYSEPSQNPYINQYEAGEALGLPISSASSGSVKGGNACGPSSLTMLINSFKFSNAKTKRLPIFLAGDFSPGEKVSVYGKTMVSQPINNVDNQFSWSKALTFVKSELAYLDANNFELTHPTTPRTVNDLKAFIDDNLSSGIPVLVSTTFSSKKRTSPNPYSGGHVILFVGRTLTGDYIVKDPAGDYLAGPPDTNGHYNLNTDGSVKSCGANVIYPQDKVKLNIAKRENVEDNSATGGNNDGICQTGETCISILKRFINSMSLTEEPTSNLDEAAPRSALAIPTSASADPDGFLVIGHFTGPGSRPYQLWVEDSGGRRTGWLANGDKIVDIPDSIADVDPILPSDPDSDSEKIVDATSWPFMVSVNNAEEGLKLFVYGNQDAEFSLEIVRYQSGKMTTSVASSTVTAGETKNIDISTSVLISVPNVVGQTQANAVSTLTAAGLSTNVTTASSSTVPIGTTISQNPAGGANVKSGSLVNVIVSTGPALITVPNVVGQTQATAVFALTTAGLTVNVSTASSSTVLAGTVISQNPASGSKVASGSAVDMVVSSGVVSACATNVSTKVSVTLGGFRLNRTTNRYVQQITIKNTTSANISGAISLVFDSLSSNAMVFNSSGNTSCATPVSAYVNVNVGVDNMLSVGERATMVIEFANSNNKAITYSVRVLAGSPL